MKKQMHTAKGFTLIELMITVAIIGCLAAISVPPYQDYITRAKLNEAFTTLLTQRALEERYFQDHRFYTSSLGPGPLTPLSPCELINAAPPDSNANFTYRCLITTTFSPTGSSSTTFGIDAIGQNRMSGFAFTINNRNTQQTLSLPAKWGGTTAIPAGNCWVKRKGQYSC